MRDRLFPSWMPAITTRFVNPVQRLWAPWLPPFALILHRGRRSGTEYRSPVLAWRSGSTLYVVLYYGESQWVRNVLAAGGGEVVRHGKRSRLTDVRITRDGLPPAVRRVSRGLPVLAARIG
jgi:deazaflavin-dependent oxidoreductase (nitroreductase family)